MALNRNEYLLVCLAEEATEIAHRAHKLLRFGRNEIQSGQALTNEDRLIDEYLDMLAIMKMLQSEQLLRPSFKSEVDEKMDRKMRKVEEFWDYSISIGVAGREDLEHYKRVIKSLQDEIKDLIPSHNGNA